LRQEKTIMDAQTTSSIDWTSIINNTVSQIPSWIALANNQPIVTPIPQGTTGGTLYVGPSGVAGSISPGLVIAGVIGIIAVVYLLKR
jgi:hypothetical protein